MLCRLGKTSDLSRGGETDTIDGRRVVGGPHQADSDCGDRTHGHHAGPPLAPTAGQTTER